MRTFVWIPNAHIKTWSGDLHLQSGDRKNPRTCWPASLDNQWAPGSVGEPAFKKVEREIKERKHSTEIYGIIWMSTCTHIQASPNMHIHTWTCTYKNVITLVNNYEAKEGGVLTSIGGFPAPGGRSTGITVPAADGHIRYWLQVLVW